ncbi:MAG: hypothetical protein D3910_21420, partial [Candidatus Electrothrix sp. ATG2]|nr:hypothetical protein [Candidatus Electrothrix sp. ATG2]
HIIKNTLFESAPPDVRDALVEAHAEWVKEISGEIRAGRRSGRRQRKPLSQIFDIGKSKISFKVDKRTPTGQSYAEYLLSFDEWFANEAAKALPPTRRP